MLWDGDGLIVKRVAPNRASAVSRRCASSPSTPTTPPIVDGYVKARLFGEQLAHWRRQRALAKHGPRASATLSLPLFLCATPDTVATTETPCAPRAGARHGSPTTLGGTDVDNQAEEDYGAGSDKDVSPTPDRLLTTREAADELRMSRRTLERYRVTGEGPRFHKLGRLVFYRYATLIAWRDERERRSTSDPGPAPSDASVTPDSKSRRRDRRAHRAPGPSPR